MLSKYIGKVNIDGTMAIEPAPIPEWAAAYEAMKSDGTMIMIKSRTIEQLEARDSMPVELFDAIRQYVDRAKKDGKWFITMRRQNIGSANDRIRRQRNHANAYPIGEAFPLPIDAALLLLNRYPYYLIFEEVESPDEADIEDKAITINPPKTRSK